MVLATAFLAGAGSAFAQGVFNQDDTLHWTGNFGTDYSNGDYGTGKNTSVLIGLPSLSAETGNLRFNLSVPYLSIAGRGIVLFDAEGNPIILDRNAAKPARARNGFGDVNLSASYVIPPAVLDDFEVEFTGHLKLPTASQRKALGTGKVDFGGTIDVSREFGIWGPFVTLGYLIPGQPASYALDNSYSVSAGTSIHLSDALIAIVSYDYDSPNTPLVTNSQEVFGSLSWVVSDTVTLTGYGTSGLTAGAPSISAGMFASYRFN